MHRRVFPLVFAVALLPTIAAPAKAADAADEKTFLATAIGIDLGEITMGRLAQAQTGNSDIHKLAEVIVRDHTQDLARAQVLAMKLGADIPFTAPVETQPMAAQLSTLKDAAFDKPFLDQMTTDDAAAVALFTTETSNTTASADVTTYAKATVQTLQMHLRQAKQLRDPTTLK